MRILLVVILLFVLPSVYAANDPNKVVWLAPNSKSVLSSDARVMVSDFGGKVAVFKYYCDTILKMDDVRLRDQIKELRSHNVKLALECAPLSQPGFHLESFGEDLKILKVVDKISSQGGVVSFVAMDEPIYYAHYSNTGKMYVGWDIDKICKNAAGNVRPVLAKYPNIKFGLIEPINRISVEDFDKFSSCFVRDIGQTLSFFHADIIWSRPDAWQSGQRWSAFMKDRGIRYGVIFNSTLRDAENDAWIANAQNNINTYFKYNGGFDDAIIQSWNKEPHVIGATKGKRSITELSKVICDKIDCQN